MSDARRFAEIAAAVEYDNGAAVQMARYSHDDVRWLVTKLRTEKAAAAEANSAIRRLATAVGDALELCDTAKVGSSTFPLDCTNNCYDSDCDCSGKFRPLSWTLDPDAVRAALRVPATPEDTTDDN